MRADAELGRRVPNNTFDVAAPAVLAALRDALARVLAALPGPPAAPHELAKTLSLHKTLAWKVYQVAHADDPLSTVDLLPRHDGLNRFLAAAQPHVPPASIDAIRERFAALDRLIDEHAGDRDSFALLTSGLTGSDSERLALPLRRSAFQAASLTLGVQADAHYGLQVFSGRGEIDSVAVRGIVRLRRLRPDEPWIISRPQTSGPAVRTPIPHAGGTVEVGGFALLTAYCSRPLPEISVRESDQGHVEMAVLPGPVGERGAITLFAADAIASHRPHRGEPIRQLGTLVAIRTPVRRVVIDQAIPRGIIADPPKRLDLSNLLDDDPAREGQRRPLPGSTDVHELGTADRLPEADDIGCTAQLVPDIVRSMGLDPAEMVVFRGVVRYPLVGVRAEVRFERHPATPGLLRHDAEPHPTPAAHVVAGAAERAALYNPQHRDP